MRSVSRFAVGILLLVLAGAPGWAQQPRRGGRGGGFGSWDPNQMFDRLSGGKDVVKLSELTDPRQQAMFSRMAQRLNITTGEITRDQFVTAMRDRTGQGGGAPAGGTAPGQGTAAPNPDSWAESSFKRLDANGDGLLNYDEMPEELRSERDKWDANHDGFIDLAEYKTYFQARMQQRMADRSAAGFGSGMTIIAGQPEPEEEEPKQVVYRAGKLPKGLPGWFEQLDTDKDAQVGLYEWLAGGRTLGEFQQMDRNGDGFLTVQEVLNYLGRNKQSPSANGSFGRSVADSGGPTGQAPSGQNRGRRSRMR
jgi:Ca2+-binding EF-hand superfamily protein